VPNWAIHMNVQANRTEKINKINIYTTHKLGYCIIPFKFIIGNRDAKQYRLSLKLQLLGQISNFVQDGYKMWAEVGLCKRLLDNKYNLRNVNKHCIILLHITSNIIVKSCH